MVPAPLLQWQQSLATRLERGLGRPLVPTDFDCIAWNSGAQTLTVEAPLLRELRACNLTSNIFRSQRIGRTESGATLSTDR